MLRKRVDEIQNNLEAVKAKKGKDIIEAFVSSDKYSEKRSSSKEAYDEK